MRPQCALEALSHTSAEDCEMTCWVPLRSRYSCCERRCTEQCSPQAAATVPGLRDSAALRVQALILNDFKDWPSSAITVEFWMWSVDKCRRGVPVSYATGGYEKADNSFLILNYNDWCALSCRHAHILEGKAFAASRTSDCSSSTVKILVEDAEAFCGGLSAVSAGTL